MTDNRLFIFFDEVIFEYTKKFGQENIYLIVKKLRKALQTQHQKFKIILITRHSTIKVRQWLIENNLSNLVDQVLNPII